jgi:hypothetical protein
MSRLDLGPTQPPKQWIAEFLSPGLEQRGCKADHAPPASAEATNEYLHFPNMSSQCGAKLSNGYLHGVIFS